MSYVVIRRETLERVRDASARHVQAFLSDEMRVAIAALDQALSAPEGRYLILDRESSMTVTPANVHGAAGVNPAILALTEEATP